MFTPILGTLLGTFNLFLLGFLVPLNSYLQVALIEILSYFPTVLLALVFFLKNKSKIHDSNYNAT